MILSIFKTCIIAFFSLFFTSLIILFPKVSVDASIEGLTLWWHNVFPALLPFFILSELMMAFGIVRFIGVLLEPVMRPLFKVPGIGGFVLVMGIVSGFPNGAKITANLYKQKLISEIEAVRLSTFTNFSNPLFLFGVVAYGFFHSAKLGFILAGSHYLGNLCIGFCMRFYKGRAQQSMLRKRKRTGLSKVFSHAFFTMHETRIHQKQPLGKTLGDAVQASMSTLLMVGGFIILFSVISHLLEHIHVLEATSKLLVPIFYLFHITPLLTHPFITGWFEMTIGAKNISQTNASLLERVMLTSFLLGFSGLSVQSQVVSLLSEAKINVRPFLYSRLAHGILAAVFATIGCIYFLPKTIFSFPAWDVIATIARPAIKLSVGDLYPYLVFFITVILLVFYIYWTVFRPMIEKLR